MVAVDTEKWVDVRYILEDKWMVHADGSVWKRRENKDDS